MTKFGKQLEDLLTKEAHACQNDPDRIGSMVEEVVKGFGFTVAIASHGDPKLLDTLMMGCEKYAHEVAVKQAGVIRMFRGVK